MVLPKPNQQTKHFTTATLVAQFQRKNAGHSCDFLLLNQLKEWCLVMESENWKHFRLKSAKMDVWDFRIEKSVIQLTFKFNVDMLIIVST